MGDFSVTLAGPLRLRGAFLKQCHGGIPVWVLDSES